MIWIYFIMKNPDSSAMTGSEGQRKIKENNICQFVTFWLLLKKCLLILIDCTLLWDYALIIHYETVSCEFLTYFICHLIISHLIFYHQFCLLILILSIFIINLDYSYSSSLMLSIFLIIIIMDSVYFTELWRISVMMNFMFYENDNVAQNRRCIFVINLMWHENDNIGRNCRYIFVMNFM